MGLLTAVEQGIDSLVRRVFPKRQGDAVQPVEIAREMAKAMESRRTVSVDAVYVPNVYWASVHPGDFEALRPVMNTVKRDAAAYIERIAQKRGLSFAGPVRLEVVAESSVEPGRVSVTAEFEEATRDEGAPFDRLESAPFKAQAGAADAPTRLYPAVSDKTLVRIRPGEEGCGLAWLEVTSGPEKGRRVFLHPGQRYVIGRAEGTDLVLADTRVSKRHAELRFHGGEWRILDLDSTNGTRINGRSVREEALSDGDEVAVGLTTLKFGASCSETRVEFERG